MAIELHPSNELQIANRAPEGGDRPAAVSALTTPPFEPVSATPEPEPQPRPDPEPEMATLQFVGGVSNLTIRVDPTLTTRYAARFEGPQPDVTEFGDEITIRYPWGFAWGRTAADVRLRGDVVWSLRVRGGTSRGEIDLRGAQLVRFEITGGVSRLEMELDEARGIVPVRIRGGASRVEISRPAASAAQVQVNGGASRLSLDEQSFGSVGGHIRLESAGFATVGDRFEIEVGGGASRLSVRSRPGAA